MVIQIPADEELIEEIKSGSQAAMEVLVKRHYKQIFAYIYRTVSDYHTAYDLTQEVFIKMMQSIDRYQGKGKFPNWLITIAVNHCRDYFRSRHFQQKEQEQELQKYITDRRENVWDLLSKKWDSEQVKRAIESLPSFQREAIVLRYFHDYKIKEISEITDAKESTVKSRIRQGTIKLKRMLEGGHRDHEVKGRRSNE